MSARFPYEILATGTTAVSSEEQHVKDLILQTLLTQPGERVNQPTFGCGLMSLVFGAGGDEVAAATKFLVHGALQQTLSDRISLLDVQVTADESQLQVVVVYMLRNDNKKQSVTVVRST